MLADFKNILDGPAEVNAEKLDCMYGLEYHGFKAGVQVICGVFRDLHVGGIVNKDYQYFLFYGQTRAEAELAFRKLVDEIQEVLPWAKD